MNGGRDSLVLLLSGFSDGAHTYLSATLEHRRSQETARSAKLKQLSVYSTRVGVDTCHVPGVCALDHPENKVLYYLA
jgi:hypothetical protein